MFSEQKLSQVGQKNNKIMVKITVLNLKNCRSKLSIEMFIKRKTKAEKTYAYRMLLGFKTLVTF